MLISISVKSYKITFYFLDVFFSHIFLKSSRQRIARNDINFIESEIYELLDSCNNYDTFKGLILDYRLQKEGRYRNLQDFKILTVSKAFDDKLD